MRWHAEAWRIFFLDHGIVLDIPEFHAKTAGMPTLAVLSHYLRRRIPDAEGRRLALRKERIYRNLYRPHLRPAPGLRDFLRGARRGGIRLGVGTGSRAANVGSVLDGLSLRRRFDAVITGARCAAASRIRDFPDPGPQAEFPSAACLATRFWGGAARRADENSRPDHPIPRPSSGERP